MSEEDPEDDSVESVSSPAEQDDDPTSQGNDPNIDEEDEENDDDGNGDDGDGKLFSLVAFVFDVEHFRFSPCL